MYLKHILKYSDLVPSASSSVRYLNSVFSILSLFPHCLKMNLHDQLIYDNDLIHCFKLKKVSKQWCEDQGWRSASGSCQNPSEISRSRIWHLYFFDESSSSTSVFNSFRRSTSALEMSENAFATGSGSTERRRSDQITTLDLLSPLFIHPSGMIPSTIQLVVDNYRRWKKSIMKALSVKIE